MEKLVTVIILMIIIAALIIYILVRHPTVQRLEVLAKERKAREDQAERNLALGEERRNRLEALDAYNEACNMEPFCGEGKKKRERKQESRVVKSDSHEPPFFGFSAASESSRPSSHSSYSGHGGSFDGGGASGDWSSSSSISSDSGSCSSSSSDSCSSSD